jgi:heme/copper-type cytochrome/quinol oxidase subunit 2
MMPVPRFGAVAALALVAVLTEAARGAGGAQQREFKVQGRDFSFAPARIEVTQDDLVKVTFHAVDIAHSFTIDSYRISKRAGAGQSVTFEFHASQPGTFPFYCNLSLDDRCRQMHGELVVHGR